MRQTVKVPESASPTPEVIRFLRYVAAHVELAHLDDAIETLDCLSDAKLAVICRAKIGEPVIDSRGLKSLNYSCELRQRVYEILDDLELYLPSDNSQGRIEPILKQHTQ